MPDPRRIAHTVAVLEALGPGPRTVLEVLSVGLTPGQLRAAVAAGALVRLRRGVVMPAQEWRAASTDQRRRWALATALRCFPGAFASHGSAALLHGLPDYGTDTSGDPPLTDITRRGASRTDGWIRVHGCDTGQGQVAMIDSMPVTSLPRTSIDMAATRSLRTAVVFLDAAMRVRVERAYGADRVRERALSPRVRAALHAEWDENVRPYGRHRWVTRVREAIRLADPAAESVLESLSRVAIIESGLPRPRCGVPIVGDDGVTYWGDMVWDEYRLVGEADGLAKYDSVERLIAEKRRQESLEGAGWRVVRWGMAEVRPSAEPMLSRIRAAMTRAQLPRRPGLS